MTWRGASSVTFSLHRRQRRLKPARRPPQHTKNGLGTGRFREGRRTPIFCEDAAMTDDFWDLVARGASEALSGAASEPFGIWPMPPLPQPVRSPEPVSQQTKQQGDNE